MALLIFFSGVAIWLLLERQKIRHAKEIEIECARLDFPPPPAPPGLPALEALLNIVLGGILAGYSLVSIMVILHDPGRYHQADGGKLAAVIMAAGVVMIGVGVKRLARGRLRRAAQAAGDQEAGGKVPGRGRG
jgi:hypothetical protein